MASLRGAGRIEERKRRSAEQRARTVQGFVAKEASFDTVETVEGVSTVARVGSTGLCNPVQYRVIC
jgi:hypothetical protein